MAHLIYVKARDDKRFSYVKFGTYTQRNGKKSVLLNPDDIVVDGWEMTSALTTLNIDDEYDKRIYDFLLEHPFILQNKHYELIDTKANVKKQADSILKSAEAVQVATGIKDNELSDLTKLFGIGDGFDNDIVRAKLIQMAGQAPDRFLEIYKDADKSYRVFLKKALEKKVIQKVNDVWKHNNYTLGISDEHAIAWLKENSDVYAIMKNQVRGNFAKKEVEMEVSTEDMTSSEGVSALEKAVDAQKGWFKKGQK
jgi:bifunctional DNA-binding transcriptional regulator/antitoxin component of YhaV-PrlF toxin-antitoxin module